MMICVKNFNASAPDLSPYYVKDFSNNCDGDKMIIVSQWALKEMNVPVYPEKRIFLKIRKYLSDKYPGASVKGFLFYEYKKEKLE